MLLMQEVPGRLWDGKEVILEAFGELIAIEPHCVKPEEDVITALLGAAVASLRGYHKRASFVSVGPQADFALQLPVHRGSQHAAQLCKCGTLLLSDANA